MAHGYSVGDQVRVVRKEGILNYETEAPYGAIGTVTQADVWENSFRADFPGGRGVFTDDHEVVPHTGAVPAVNPAVILSTLSVDDLLALERHMIIDRDEVRAALGLTA